VKPYPMDCTGVRQLKNYVVDLLGYYYFQVERVCPIYIFAKCMFEVLPEKLCKIMQ